MSSAIVFENKKALNMYRRNLFSAFMLGMVIGGSIVLGMFALVGY